MLGLHTRLIYCVLQKFDSEEDFLQTAQSDVANLCAENVILWHKYLKVVTLNDKVTHQLAKEHHLQRVCVCLCGCVCVCVRV